MKKKKIIIPIIVIIILAIVGTIAFFLISGHEHSFGEWETQTPATCEDAEIEVRKCDCGEEETREGDPALGHVFTSISAECIMERPMEQLTLTPDDLKVTGKCERCDGAEITEGYEIEGGTLVLGENIVTIKYGDLSTTLNIWAYELDVALETIVLEDTYVSSSNKDNENTEKTEMGTKTDINRLYYKIDASEVLDSELFKVNKESAKVRFVLAITEGMVNEETEFTLKAFKPDTVDSDVDFTQLTWNNVDKTTGSYKSYNWGNADEILKAGVGSNVAIQRGYLMITLPYDQMEQYIDEEGMLLLAFGSNTSGFKVASLENKTETNHPRFEIVLNQEHIHVFDQEVIASKYLACDNGDGTIEYYKSCACGAAGTETFTVYTSRGDAYEVSAVITDDTYVSSANKEAKDTEHTQSKHLSTKYTTGRSYFRVNVKDALQSEQFKANSKNAMMQFVFCVTDGEVTDDTRYILKAYTPQKGVTNVNFKKLTWNSVDSTSGKYSTIHWSKGNILVDSVVGKNVTVSSGSDKYITITVHYNQIAKYVDENGDVLFAFATRPEDTNADGIKIGSLENGMKAHRPVCGFLFDTEHSCSFDQKVVAEKYLASEATCEKKAQYYYSCLCGEKGTETFKYGEKLGHKITTITASANIKEYAVGDQVTAEDISVTGKCTTCGKNLALTDGVVVDSKTLASGANKITVKYGKLSTTVTITIEENIDQVYGSVLDDTYVAGGDAAGVDHVAKEELGMYSESFRTYIRVNMNEILEDENFQKHPDGAKVQLILAVTSGEITDKTTFTLKAYEPQKGVTDTVFSNITWTNVDKTSGTLKNLHWSNGKTLLNKQAVGENISVDGKYITITVNYYDIKDYVDEKGNLLLAVASSTSGLKVGSLENTDESNRPVWRLLVDEVHVCTYDQKVANETYKKSDATCTEKAQYYKSCACGKCDKTKTFEHGETLPHTIDSISVTQEKSQILVVASPTEASLRTYISRFVATIFEANPLALEKQTELSKEVKITEDNIYVYGHCKECDNGAVDIKENLTEGQTLDIQVEVVDKDGKPVEGNKVSAGNYTAQVICKVTNADGTDATPKEWYESENENEPKKEIKTEIKVFQENKVTEQIADVTGCADTYVSSSNDEEKGADHSQAEQMGTYYESFRNYIRVNVNDILEQDFMKSEEGAQEVELVLAVTDGQIQKDTKYILKAYEPQAGVTDVAFSKITWNSVNNNSEKGDIGAYQALHWSKGTELVSGTTENPSVKVEGKYITIKMYYHDIEKFVDEDGDIVFAFATNTKGLKIGTFENEEPKNRPIFKIAHDEQHECVYDQKDIEKEYLVNEATCTTKAQYHYSCECGKAGTETFEYGDIKHSYKQIHKQAEATCAASGWRNTIYQCSDCEHYFIKVEGKYVETTKEEQKIAKLEHTYGALIAQKEPTCTKTGMKAHYLCTVCGTYFDKNQKETTEEALTIQVHNCVMLAKEPTCTEPGWKTKDGAAIYKCKSGCEGYFIENADGVYVSITEKEKESYKIDKLGHNYASITAKIKDEDMKFAVGDTVSAKDLVVTGTCKAENCTDEDKIIEISSKDVTVENTPLKYGENTISVSYGELSASITITADYYGKVTADTYVSSSNKDTAYSTVDSMGTNSESYRTYFHVNISKILNADGFDKLNPEHQVQFILSITDGKIVTEDGETISKTKFTLKAYEPTDGVTDEKVNALTWNNVDINKDEAANKELHWNNGTTLVSESVVDDQAVTVDGNVVTITMSYQDIKEYVDSKGNILFAFASNTSGLKVGSMDNATISSQPYLKVSLADETSELYGTITDDTYVYTGGSSADNTGKTELRTYSDDSRSYIRVNINDILTDERYKGLPQTGAMVQLILTATEVKSEDGKIAEDTTFTVKAYDSCEVDFKDITFNNVKTTGSYSLLNWNKGTILASETTVEGNCITITMCYHTIQNYVDKNGDILLAFATKAEGIKVGSIENKTHANKPVIKVIPGEYTFTSKEAKPAGCTEDGKKAHFTCDACSKYFIVAEETKTEVTEADLIVPAKGHVLDNPTFSYTGGKVAGKEFEASDFVVKGQCTSCQTEVETSDGITLGEDTSKPVLGTNTVTVNYGEKTYEVQFDITTISLDGNSVQDTYINSSNNSIVSDNASATSLKTYIAGNMAAYFKVNIGKALQCSNPENIRVELILKDTSGKLVDSTNYSVKVYNPTVGSTLDISALDLATVSDDDYKKILWSSASLKTIFDKESADNHSICVSSSTDTNTLDTIKITLAYSQIEDYIQYDTDGNGYLILAFGTNTSGLTIGSMENTTNAPEINLILGEEHFCVYDSVETVEEANRKSEATCASPAIYYYTCNHENCKNVFKNDSKTFTYGEAAAHDLYITAELANSKTYYAQDSITASDFSVKLCCKNSKNCNYPEKIITESLVISNNSSNPGESVTLVEGENIINVTYKPGDGKELIAESVKIHAESHVHNLETITATFKGATTSKDTEISASDFKVSGTCSTCKENVTVDATGISIKDASGNLISDNKLVAGINTITVSYKNPNGESTVTCEVKIQATDSHTETVQVDCDVLDDTYVKTSSEKDNGFYDDETLWSYRKNDSTSYRAYLRYNFSDVFDGDTFKGNEDGAIVQFTFTIANGTLTDANDITFKYYAVSKDTNYQDVKFSDIYKPNLEEGGPLEKLHWNNGKDITLKKSEESTSNDLVTIEDTNGDSTTGNVGDKIIIEVPYSNIKNAIDSDNKDAIFALVLDKSTDNTELKLSVASLENTTYDSPTVSVIYTNKSATQGIYFSTVSQATDASELAEISETGYTGDGTKENPYTSLDVLSEIDVIAPGTHIYLKRGSVFTGSMKLANISGTEDAPIVVTSYGTGAKPKIELDNLGENSGAIHIENCSHIVVDGLEICDESSEGDNTEAVNKRGVLITCDNPTAGNTDVVTYYNITLRNLNIHDIIGYVDDTSDGNGPGMTVDSKKTGGIQLWSNDGYGRVDGLTITGCTIHDVSNAGIATWYKTSDEDKDKISPYRDDFNTYAHSNVVISNNEIYNIAKNAIFVRNLDGGVIEYNTIHDTATCGSGNMIVTSYVDGTVIQYNEGYNNKAESYTINDVTTYEDGAMLDADLASKNTIWQYNYSHDNAFGLFLNCTKNEGDFKDEVIVRYNLSVNDKGNKGIIYINYPAAGIYVYNNTIVTGTDTKCIIQCKQDNAYFYNNIIYNRATSAKFDIVDGVKVTASDNQIYSEEGCTIENEAKLNNVLSSTKPELKIELLDGTVYNCEITEDTYVESDKEDVNTGMELLQSNKDTQRIYIKANISKFIESGKDTSGATVKLILTLNNASIESVNCMLKGFLSSDETVDLSTITFANVKNSSIGWTKGTKLLSDNDSYIQCNVKDGKLVLEFNYNKIVNDEVNMVDDDGNILFAFVIKEGGVSVCSNEYQLKSNPRFNLEGSTELPVTSPSFGDLDIFKVQSTSDALLYGVDIADIADTPVNSSQSGKFTLDDFKVETDFFGNIYKPSIGCCSEGVETETETESETN